MVMNNSADWTHGRELAVCDATASVPHVGAWAGNGLGEDMIFLSSRDKGQLKLAKFHGEIHYFIYFYGHFQ